MAKANKEEMIKSDKELRKCRFCGTGKGKLYITRGYFKYYVVICQECGCRTNEENTPEAAVSKWQGNKKGCIETMMEVIRRIVRKAGKKE